MNPTVETAFKVTIPLFFEACSPLQLPGDRIHVTLMQEKDGFWKTRQMQNPIVRASTQTGYRLIRKRIFGSERYSQYQHVKTDQTPHSEGVKREFVFQKAHPTQSTDPEKLKNPEEKLYSVKTDIKGKEVPLADYYFKCSTYEDSSDYYD